MELIGKKVRLRAVEESDCEHLRRLANSPEFEKMIVGWAFPISTADEARWFADCRNDESRLRYTIESDEDGAVGMIGLRNIDWKNGSAEGLGMRIFEKNIRGKGYATDAYMTLLRYAFNELRLNRVSTTVLWYNAPSLRVLEKCGFKTEGIQRKAIYKNGEYNDLIIKGCLKADYQDLISNNHYWD